MKFNIKLATSKVSAMPGARARQYNEITDQFIEELIRVFMGSLLEDVDAQKIIGAIHANYGEPYVRQQPGHQRPSEFQRT